MVATPGAGTNVPMWLRVESLVLRPPVRDMETLWRAPEKEAVKSFLEMALIGGPETIRTGLERLLANTQADELIFTCDLYEHAQGLLAFEILASLKSA